MITYAPQLPPAEPRRLFAAGKAAAYYMEPPELAAKPFVTQAVWSGDGSSLIVRRLVPPAGTSPLVLADAQQSERLEGMMKLRPRVQLVAWSRTAHTSRIVLDLDSAKADFDEVEPMVGSDRALVLLSERAALPDGTLSAPRSSYVLVALGAGTVARLWTESADGRGTHVELSPSRPLGAIVRDASRRPVAVAPNSAGVPPTGTVAFFGPDGRVGPEIPILPRRHFTFAADGGAAMMVYTTDKRGKATYELHRLDPKTGVVGTAAIPVAFAEDEKEPPMSVKRDSGTKGEAGIFLHVAGGERGELGLVSTDGALPSVSPGNDAVAYVYGGGAYVRSLVKVDRKAYELAMLDAEKTKAMRAAKQVGLALSMYAADYDGVFPGGDLRGTVDPYMQDRNMLSSFTYQYGGGTPSQSGDPATIVLGFVAGPGGRAVVYADGHVGWIPD